VRPWTGPLPAPAREESFLLVRAAFTLVDGTRLPGYLTPQPQVQEQDLGFMQPHLFTPSGEIRSCWCGEGDRAYFYEGIGKSLGEVFPIVFAIDQDLTTGQLTGVIAGLGRRTRGANGPDMEVTP
jgi:hypothetical protein